MTARNSSLITKLGIKISREEEKLLKTKSFHALRMNCLFRKQRDFGIHSDLALRESLEGVQTAAVAGMTSYTDAKKQLRETADLLCMKESEFAIVREGCAISKRRAPRAPRGRDRDRDGRDKSDGERATEATAQRLQRSLDSKDAAVKALQDECASLGLRLESQRAISERGESLELARVREESRNRSVVEARLRALEGRYISLARGSGGRE